MSAGLHKICSCNKNQLRYARIFFKTFHRLDIENNEKGFEPEQQDQNDWFFSEHNGIPKNTMKDILENYAYARMEGKNSDYMDALLKRYAKLEDHVITRDPIGFRGFYAMIHDDSDMTCTNQVMLILNNAGHRLWSEVDNTFLVPKAGNIIFLDIAKKHALLPNKDLTPKECSDNPLEFYGFCY